MATNVRRKNPNALAQLTTRMQEVAAKEVAVGYPKGKAQAYPAGESVIDVAVKNCFGIGVPVRDFMTYARVLIQDDATIQEIIAAIAKETGKPDWNPAVVAKLQEAAGAQGAELIRKAILEGVWEPNSDATIARKGSERPLIDTSHMKNSATWVTRDKRK